MDRGDRSDAASDGVRRRVRAVLSEHPVSFAMLFGSAGRGTADETSDLETTLLATDHGRFRGVAR